MQRKLEPFVSVIVPVYNGEKTVVACLDSLLLQTYPRKNCEIIIVDNKSTDNTLELLKPYVATNKIRLYSETNVLNAYGARNTGIRHAKGDILAFTDADCEAEPDWLEKLVLPFVDSLIGCVSGNILPAMPKNVIEKYWTEEFLSLERDRIKKIPRVLGGSCAFRIQVVEKVGYFRETPPSGGDTELAVRMIENTQYKIFLALNAIVRHHNVSTLKAFFKQAMRYGTQKTRRTQGKSLEENNKSSFFYASKRSMILFGSFLKRISLAIVNSFPKSVSMNDRDIYLARPLLSIVNEFASWWGYRLVSKNIDLKR